ncbi:MAG TPA: DUF2911 domain-containing protein [Gemmatimonadaceae bacterium]|jgi:hypothetical protein|nr:DUF2911 domain-containing protein [Gemmatimonadaceae bacterium]
MTPRFLAAALIAVSTLVRPTAPSERAAFVTTLGRDTVVIESFTRTDRHVDGSIVVRIPGTVLCHYAADLDKDGAVTHTVLDIKPLGTPDVRAQRVTMDFDGLEVHITTDGANGPQSATRELAKVAFPFFMTGFGASYGLYSSLGMYELFLPRVLSAAHDTTPVYAIDMATLKTGTREFVRHSPTLVDVDYFGIAWTHLTVDADAHITSVNASQTTEQTQSHRTDFLDVERLAKAFAAADHAGKGVGAASPNRIANGMIGSTQVSVAFGSPKKRDRAILGNVVPYDQVWRTGANEATTISFARDVTVSGKAVPAGTYSLWTIPARDGTVQLIINRQHGQWGTDYDSAQDLVHVPMQVATAATPQEDFTIDLTGADNNGAQLRMSWDTFVWTAPIAVR